MRRRQRLHIVSLKPRQWLQIVSLKPRQRLHIVTLKPRQRLQIRDLRIWQRLYIIASVAIYFDALLFAFLVSDSDIMSSDDSEEENISSVVQPGFDDPDCDPYRLDVIFEDLCIQTAELEYILN